VRRTEVIRALVVGFCVLSCSTADTPAPGADQAAEQAPVTDPFAYCAAVGNADAPAAPYAGPAIPEALIAGVRRTFDMAPDAPEEWVTRGLSWRCMDGQVYGCHAGANLPCLEQADTSRTPSDAIVDFCEADPDADAIPLSVAGRRTVYAWRCRGGMPEIGEHVAEPDARGFIAHIWYRIEP